MTAQHKALIPLAEAIATSKGWIGLYSVPRAQREAFIEHAREVLRHLDVHGFDVVSK